LTMTGRSRPMRIASLTTVGARAGAVPILPRAVPMMGAFVRLYWMKVAFIAHPRARGVVHEGGDNVGTSGA
jgi:hypothetical protein